MEEVHTMKRFYSFVSMALLLATTMGCTDKAGKNQDLSATEEAQLSVQAQAGDAEAARKLERLQKARDAKPESDMAVAPDIRDGWQWSKEEIVALKKRATSGDMQAADRLSQYYSVHEDEVNEGYWEDWLFKRGDPGAIKRRAHRVYSASEQRSANNPRKLRELKEAEQLWQSATSERTDNPFLDKMRLEIASIENRR
jgi:hypothetical protein